MQIDQIEDDEISDEALEAAGTGAWTFVCTGGFQCNSFSGCFRENPSATRQSRDFSGPVLGASGPRPPTSWTGPDPSILPSYDVILVKALMGR